MSDIPTANDATGRVVKEATSFSVQIGLHFLWSVYLNGCNNLSRDVPAAMAIWLLSDERV